MDRSSTTTRPGLTLALLSTAHAAIHAQSALMPLVYPIVIVEYGLNAADIGTFIAITTAVGGTMQLAHGFLTRVVARPALIPVAGQGPAMINGRGLYSAAFAVNAAGTGATSGTTTYVAGSATCVGAGTCTVTQPGADHKITWELGDMAAGTTRQVTFKVTIDDVAGDPGETVAVDILNAGAVQSCRMVPEACSERSLS